MAIAIGREKFEYSTIKLADSESPSFGTRGKESAGVTISCTIRVKLKSGSPLLLIRHVLVRGEILSCNQMTSQHSAKMGFWPISFSGHFEKFEGQCR